MIERFRAAPPARQFSLALGAILVIALLMGALWYAFLRTSYAPLFTRMRGIDAATIVAELDKRKIPYRLADGGTTILIPQDQVDATRLSVMSEDIPIKGTVGFELFNDSDMGLTDFAQKINYQRALQGELARTIMSLDGVAFARVHLSLGENRVFRDDRIPPKASVTIRPAGTRFPDDAARGVQRLVAAAVPQLDTANVVILDETGRVISQGPSTPESLSPSPMLREASAIEQYYAARAEAAVRPIYPSPGMSITVRAELPPGASQALLAQWAPGSREFPLKVTVATVDPLAAQVQSDIRGAIETAAGFDTTLGDALAFTVVAPAHEGHDRGAAPRAAPRPAVSDPPAEPVSQGASRWLWPAFAILALLGILVLLSIRGRVQPMTEGQRATFAARLSAALREEDRHAG